MKTLAFRASEFLLSVAILVTLAHLLLIMYFAGYSLSLSFMTIKAQHVAPPTILLMVLILLRVSMRCYASSGKDISAYIPAAIFCVFMILYLANGVTKWTHDTLPARYLPLSILREGNLDLNEFTFLYTQRLPYYLHHLNSHYVSNYPVGPAIAALPIYLIPALGGVAPTDRLIEEFEKLAAASVVALSACILYLVLRRLGSERVSLFLTVIYAMGTSSFSVSSQALWQHGPSQLALATGLYSLIRGRDTPGWIGLAGFSLAFAVICRPLDLLLVLPLSAYVVLYHRPQIGHFLLGGLPPALFQLWYNYTYFHNPFFQPYGRAFWSTSLMEGLGGILLSPGRGLFVYSPILLYSFLGMALAWLCRGDPLLRALSVGVLPTLLLYGKWFNWWGGWSYGPRLLADLTPVLTVCLVPWVVRLETPYRLRWTLMGGRWLFLVLALWSIWAHALGAFWDDGRWNASPNIALLPQRLWSVASSPLVEYGQDVFARLRIAIRRLPTSRSAPELLSADFRSEPPSFTDVAPSEASQCPVPLCITAVNTGPAVWLASIGSEKGAIMLAWRWIKEEREVSDFAGMEPLRHAVFPGGSYEFQIPFLHMPSEPGQYILELEMTNAYFSKFSGWRSKSLTIPVTVPSWTAEPTWTTEVLLQYLHGPVVASINAPKLRVVLDRANYRRGEHLRIIYQLAVAEQPVLMHAYLALEQPEGDVALATISGEGIIKPTTHFRAESSIYLHKKFHISGWLTLPLPEELPHGHYTLYFFFTKAGRYEMLTKATAHFLLEP